MLALKHLKTNYCILAPLHRLLLATDFFTLFQTELAKGCDSPPPQYDCFQSVCAQPLPPQYHESAKKKIIPSDCGRAPTLECINPQTQKTVSYTLVVEACGVYTFVESGYQYLVIYDVVTNCVTIKNCVRYASYNEILVFVINNGVLCTCTGDSRGVVYYSAVTRTAVS